MPEQLALEPEGGWPPVDKNAYARKTAANGQIVWDLLANNPGGLTMTDLIELSELTRAQVRKAFEWIRALFANEQGQPIVFIPGKHKNVYKLATDPLDSDDDLRRRIATWSLQIKRARTAIAQPSAAKWPEMAPAFKKLSRDMGRVEDDLEWMLNHAG